MDTDPLNPNLCAEKLHALAAPERLRIVRYLQGGPRNVGEIADMLKTKPVNVTHHLNVLRAARLIQSEKQGRFVLCSLPPGLFVADDEKGRLDLGCCSLELPLSDCQKETEEE